MASVRLQPPSPFDFKQPDEWAKWKRRFEQFRLASGLSGDDDDKKIGTLLYCMGEAAEETLGSTSITAEQRKTYAGVIASFAAFFNVRKNVILERARFNRRSQNPDESVETFITSLYSLSADCAYGNLRDQMIRDRIVVGIRDHKLSERLQLDPDLTLEKAKTLVRQREAVQEQQSALRGNPRHESTVDYVRRKPQGKREQKRAGSVRRPGEQKPQHKCSRCGKGPHPRYSCPASKSVCHACGKMGHYSSQCFTKTVGDVKLTYSSDESEGEDVSYLNTVNAEKASTAWCTSVSINGQSKLFKLDTGAEVTVISDKTYKSLGAAKLERTTKRLCGPDRKPLEVMGEFSATLRYRDRTFTHPVYVIKRLQQDLLGLPAIQALELLTQVNAIGESVTDRYPDLFTGLGQFPCTYEIELAPDAKPFALFTPRNVALPLRKKVQEELSRMESLGVISKVEKPTKCALAW